jgi:hypothetical protein
MAKSTDSVISIVRAGGNVIIGEQHSTDSVISIVRAAVQSGAHVTVKEGNKSTDSLVSIARAGKSSVTFDLT